MALRGMALGHVEAQLGRADKGLLAVEAGVRFLLVARLLGPGPGTTKKWLGYSPMADPAKRWLRSL